MDRDQAIVKARMEGKTYREIAPQFDLTSERIRQICLELLTDEQQAEARIAVIETRREQELGEFTKTDIMTAYDESRNMAAVGRRFGLPLKTVKWALENYEPGACFLPPLMNVHRRYQDIEMLLALRAAASHLGEPLTVKKYRAWRTADRPSQTLFERRFGSWVEACNAAGVVPGSANRSYQRTSSDGLWEALESYVKTTACPTFTGYCEWATKHDVPSAYLIRLRFGTWRDALESICG